MLENKVNKVGRPKKMGLKYELKKKISKVTEKYFQSEEFERDLALKNGNVRLKTHLSMLPYVLPKAESIKASLLGLSEDEQIDLVQTLRDELSAKA